MPSTKSVPGTLNGSALDLHCEVEEISPETAKAMLAAGNRKNRHLSEPAVRRLGGIIDRGEWMEDSTDAIGLAADGAVVNGQHRLETIARGNVTVRALVLRGVRPSVIKIIDQGMSRNLTQMLQIDGTYPEPGTIATAVTQLYKMAGRFERTMPTDHKPTIPQLLELLAAHPHLVDSLDAAGSVRSRFKVLYKGELAAYHYAMAEADSDLADEFFGQLGTGLDLAEGSPAYLLQEKFGQDMLKPPGKAMDKWEAITCLVRAWEATRAGQKPLAKVLFKVTRSGSKATVVPTISGVTWLTDTELEDPEV